MLTEREAQVSGDPSSSPVELLGRSVAILRAQEELRRAAAITGGILLVAEAGVDVEAVASDLHARGSSADAPFVPVDCADEIGHLEHVLFGEAEPSNEDGLETVAPESRILAARGGTLFLRDVDELPASAQARLARIARDAEVLVLGQPTMLPFRLCASALPGIAADVRAGSFRTDLFRRLSVSRIDLPPLRDRFEDIPGLALAVLSHVCDSREVRPITFSQAALALVSSLSWPGNLAELHAFIAAVVADMHETGYPAGTPIHIEHLLPVLKLDRAPARFVPTGSLREARLRFERDYIAAVLQHHEWRMSAAAQTLGIQRPNLYRKARQLGIRLSRTIK
jgi:two-component system nitrogen regulation response regulator NtrX